MPSHNYNLRAGRNQHTHRVSLNAAGNGVSSVDAGHSHRVVGRRVLLARLPGAKAGHSHPIQKRNI